jgi:hypothetical protein
MAILVLWKTLCILIVGNDKEVQTLHIIGQPCHEPHLWRDVFDQSL